MTAPALDADILFEDVDILHHRWTGICVGLGDGTVRVLVPCWGHGYDTVTIRPEQIIEVRPWTGATPRAR